jgi:hypothetical protein
MVPLMHVMSFPQGVNLDLFLGSSQMSQPTSHPTTPHARKVGVFMERVGPSSKAAFIDKVMEQMQIA